MKETLQPRSNDAGSAAKAGTGEAGAAEPLLSIDSPVLQDVAVTLQVRLGSASMSVRELLALRPGSNVTLDRKINEPADLYLNQTLIARGEVVAVEDRFGIRIVEIANK